jgi:hypothetical protein
MGPERCEHRESSYSVSRRELDTVGCDAGLWDTFIRFIRLSLYIASPLADFITGLQKHHFLSTNIAVGVSDNTKATSNSVATHNINQ